MTEARPPLPEDSLASTSSGVTIAVPGAPPANGEIVALAEPEAPKPRRILTLRNYAWLVGAALVVFFGLR